jgi:hypothetical protein
MGRNMCRSYGEVIGINKALVFLLPLLFIFIFPLFSFFLFFFLFFVLVFIV